MDFLILIKTLQETVAAQAELIGALQENKVTQAKLIGALHDSHATQNLMIDTLNAQVKNLETEISLLKNKKNSNNSHIPPSKDENRVKKNQSLREKTDRKAGGQPGHEGTTLECSAEVDEFIKHSPVFCNCCGNDLSTVEEIFIASRQIIDIPPIKLKRIEHQVFERQCSCGHTTQSQFPQYVANPVQYGPNAEALVGYLHTRQYLPYARMQEFFNDVMGLPVSSGGINNILQRLTKKAMPFYDKIKERIEQATCIGTDETGQNINGKKYWMWTWQNDKLTYMLSSESRGFKTIEDAFENGLPSTVLVHDRWACHFKMDAKGHQMCIAHLLRDLNYIDELYRKQCGWTGNFKTLLREAIQLKKDFSVTDYYGPNAERQKLFDKLEQSLHYPIHENYPKSKSLQKKLLAKQDCILYFLQQPNVPPDNNGSERAIRNVKVKQKISGHFKSTQGADIFAILRSVVDTVIKSGQNVLNALFLIASYGTE